MSEVKRRTPWWIPPFLGRVPEGLEPAPLRLLGAVALALLFEEYDMAMLTSAWKHIAQDLGMPEKDFGFYLAVIRLGAVPAFVLVPLADKLGRRPVFIAATTVLGVLTFATAFVTTPLQFVIVQALTRTFFVTGAAVAFVMITEEFPAQHRGWGMGMLAALGSMGHGLGAALFSQIDRLPFGWRALYAVGIVPVLCLPIFRRTITETARFTEHARTRITPAVAKSIVHEAIEPIRSLVALNPARAIGLSACGFLLAASMLPAFQFTGYYTQHSLGFTPQRYSLMVLLGGGIGIIGNIAAGRLGDAFGRKLVGSVLLVSFPIAAFVFYRGSQWVTFGAWIPLVFSAMGGRVILRALSTELFATSHRSAAAGAFSVMETLGAVAGLLLVHAYGIEDSADLALIVPYTALLVLGAALGLWFFPETKLRELEDISHHGGH